MARPASDARERILETALALLRAEGIKGFSQPKIAKASGVPQGHLTYYFPKKSDLLHAVAARFSEDVAAAAREMAAAGPAALGPGFQLIGGLARDRARTRTLLGLLVEVEGDARLRAALISNTDGVIAALGGLIGAERGSVDAELALCTLWGVGLMHLLRDGRAQDARTSALLDELHARLDRKQPAKRGPARVSRGKR